MHHIVMSPIERLGAAILLGERISLICVSISVVIIFWRSAFRHFASLGRRGSRIVFADQLGAGIWLTAAGLIVGEMVRLTLATFWPAISVTPIMISAGILIILTGYILHFQAWAATVHPNRPHLSLYWTIIMCLLGALGAIIGLR